MTHLLSTKITYVMINTTMVHQFWLTMGKCGQWKRNTENCVWNVSIENNSGPFKER